MKYRYRNLRMSVCTHGVSGEDLEENSVGILEWCYSEEDANEIIKLMKQDTERFENLTVVEQTDF